MVYGGLGDRKSAPTFLRRDIRPLEDRDNLRGKTLEKGFPGMRRQHEAKSSGKKKLDCV